MTPGDFFKECTMRVHPSESRAIERLGAKFDGVLRHHERMKGGTIRDTCDSIIAPE